MAIDRHIAATIVRDIARALVVLALVFLSYAHQPINVAHAASHDVLTVAVTADFCGDPSDHGSPHAPCHACRIGGGADLPPLPCGGLIHLPKAVEPVFPQRAAAAFVVAPPDIPEARGPPVLA